MRFDPATRARLGAHLTQHGTDGYPVEPVEFWDVRRHALLVGGGT